MIIYSVSCWVDEDQADAWEKYFLEEHIFDVLSTGCFLGYRFNKALESDQGKLLFVAEYYCKNKSDLDYYNQKFAKGKKQEVIDKFEGAFTASRQVYHILNEKIL